MQASGGRLPGCWARPATATAAVPGACRAARRLCPPSPNSRPRDEDNRHSACPAPPGPTRRCQLSTRRAEPCSTSSPGGGRSRVQPSGCERYGAVSGRGSCLLARHGRCISGTIRPATGLDPSGIGESLGPGPSPTAYLPLPGLLVSSDGTPRGRTFQLAPVLLRPSEPASSPSDGGPRGNNRPLASGVLRFPGQGGFRLEQVYRDAWVVAQHRCLGEGEQAVSVATQATRSS